MLPILFAACVFAQSPPDLAFVEIFDGSTVLPPAPPVGIVTRDGDDRIFLLTTGGVIRIVRSGALLPDPFVDLSFVGSQPARVLAAATFHPAFDSNGFAYLWYSDVEPSVTNEMVLARITVDPNNPDRADPTTLVELLRVPWDFGQHWGGSMEFGPDGMLWLGIGDGGLGADPECRAQDMSLLTGKMIRIDVDGAFPYSIPPDNPYLGMAGVAEEIVFAGLRHPWKWSFDEATGDVWIGDVGQWFWEEIDFIEAGRFDVNLGWSREEGSNCYLDDSCDVTPPPCGAAELVDPVFEYRHSNGGGCAVIGGHVYRGSDIPELFGTYIATDACSSRFLGIRRDASGGFEVFDHLDVRFIPQPPTSQELVSFAVDRDGELLVLDRQNRRIYRLERATGVVQACYGSRNATGLVSELRWRGSTSLVSNDAQVEVFGLPPFTPFVLLFGSTSASVPAGNGTLCIGGTLVRVSTFNTNAFGGKVVSLDFTMQPFQVGPGVVTAGSTRIFQVWHRDVGGPLGAVYNFTGAQAVTFTP